MKYVWAVFMLYLVTELLCLLVPERSDELHALKKLVVVLFLIIHLTDFA